MIKSPIFSQLAGVVHGFGSRSDDMAALFPGYWPERPIQHERHGTRIAVVEHAREDCGEADGMFTEQPGLLLSIATADCVPILLARADGRAVAALHAGWRGALAGVVDRFVDLLGERGDDPGNWVAALGPSAGACCYEVGKEVIEQFCERYALPRNVVAPRGRYLDLASIVRRQLRSAGFASVGTCAECTMCHREHEAAPFTFHSYRRDRETRTPVVDVHWSVIAIERG
ncbi:MAG: peptidoglycan editing factor PgeF [Telluria sp.]